MAYNVVLAISHEMLKAAQYELIARTQEKHYDSRAAFDAYNALNGVLAVPAIDADRWRVLLQRQYADIDECPPVAAEPDKWSFARCEDGWPRAEEPDCTIQP